MKGIYFILKSNDRHAAFCHCQVMSTVLWPVVYEPFFLKDVTLVIYFVTWDGYMV